jgi:threonyl-tRNA synthetase
MLVVGDQEMENNQVALRLRNGENPGPMAINDFMNRAMQDIENGD